MEGSTLGESLGEYCVYQKGTSNGTLDGNGDGKCDVSLRVDQSFSSEAISEVGSYLCISYGNVSSSVRISTFVLDVTALMIS